LVASAHGFNIHCVFQSLECGGVEGDLVGAAILLGKDRAAQAFTAEPAGGARVVFGFEDPPPCFAEAHAGLDREGKIAVCGLDARVCADVVLDIRQRRQAAPHCRTLCLVVGKYGSERIPGVARHEPAVGVHGTDERHEHDAHQIGKDFRAMLSVFGERIGQYGEAGKVHEDRGGAKASAQLVGSVFFDDKTGDKPAHERFLCVAVMPSLYRLCGWM
jgi:hypothetical protein